MSHKGENLEQIEDGGTHPFDVTVRKFDSDDADPVNPDAYIPPGDPTGFITPAIKIKTLSTGVLSDPPPGYNPPTVSGLAYGGSTGLFLVDVSSPGATTLSKDLVDEAWAIQWSTIVNGQPVVDHEVFTVLEAGALSFGKTLFCELSEFRDHSGFTAAQDLDDATATRFLSRAQRRFIGDASRRVDFILLEKIDDVTYRLPRDLRLHFYPSPAFNSLGSVTTVQAFLEDPYDGTFTETTVAAYDYKDRTITLSSVPPQGEAVRLTAWLSYVYFTSDDQISDVCEAILSLATHYADERITQPGKLALANPKPRRNLVKRDVSTHLKAYRDILATLVTDEQGGIRGAQTDTGLHGKRGVLN